MHRSDGYRWEYASHATSNDSSSMDFLETRCRIKVRLQRPAIQQWRVRSQSMPNKNQTTKCKKTSRKGWIHEILGTEPKHDAGRDCFRSRFNLRPGTADRRTGLTVFGYR